MSTVCRATKRDGGPCTLPTNGPDGYCWAHSPDNAAKRKQVASRAGRAKPAREVADLKREVRDLIAEVRSGRQDRNVAAVAFQGFRVLKDLVELERRIRTTDELAAEIAAIREELERRDRAQA